MARRRLRRLLQCLVPLLVAALPAHAQQQAVSVDLGAGGDETGYVRLLLLFASVSLAPALLAVTTAFARIIVVLMLLRAGLGAHEIPPTHVLIGLAILLTAVAMMPVLEPVWERAAGPLASGEIALEAAVEEARGPLQEFMSASVRPADLDLMRALAGSEAAASVETPLAVLASAYAISELRAAFLIGFIIYLPFAIIDLVVGSTLASVGMLSLPAPVLALPFKLLLFVMVDGWALVTEALVSTIR
jgi:flagellar biosynthetic protein FliP